MDISRQFNRRGLVLALFVLVTFISLIFVSPTKAMTICQPGEICTFNLASANTPCGFNERHFFTNFGSSWEFAAGEQKVITDKMGKFALADGYAWTDHYSNGVKVGGIYGGCVCDTASWLNYVAKLNGFISYAQSPGADLFTTPQVPDGYSVTIDVDDYGNGSNLQLTNSSGQPLTLKWSIDEANSTVSIWVEQGGGSQEAPTAEAIFPEAPSFEEEVPVTNEIPSESSISSPVLTSGLDIFPAGTRTPKQNFVLIAEISFVVLGIIFLIAFFRSKKFRNGVFSLLLLVIVISTISAVCFLLLRP